MIKIYTLCLLFLVIGCNKQVEKIQRNAVIDAMTSGQWKVSSYKNGSTDETASFSPYQFQFKDDFSVDAINSGNVEKTGSWTADAAAKTITSSFSNAANPLLLLNGTWKVTNNSWTFVEASQTINGNSCKLRLDKL